MIEWTKWTERLRGELRQSQRMLFQYASNNHIEKLLKKHSGKNFTFLSSKEFYLKVSQKFEESLEQTKIRLESYKVVKP